MARAVFVVDVDEVECVADGVGIDDARKVFVMRDCVLADDSTGVARGGDGRKGVNGRVLASRLPPDEAQQAQKAPPAADGGVGLRRGRRRVAAEDVLQVPAPAAEKVDEGAVAVAEVAGLKLAARKRIFIGALQRVRIDGVEVDSADVEAECRGLSRLGANDREPGEADGVGVAGAVDDLAGPVAAFKALPDGRNLPKPVAAVADGGQNLVVVEVDARPQALLLGDERPEMAVQGDVVAGTPGIRTPEVREGGTAKGTCLLGEFPADSGDDLAIRRPEIGGGRNMAVRDRAAQLPGHLDEQNGGPETASLDGGDGAGRSAANDKHVIVSHRTRSLTFSHLGRHHGGYWSMIIVLPWGFCR